MIRIGALDDSREWLRTEEKITDRYFADSGEEYEFCTYSNVNKFLLDLDEGNYFDIYLLDIEMPETNGLQVAREIKKVCLDSFIIYITGYVEYAVEAFEVNAYRYIPKKMLAEKLPEAYASLQAKLEPDEGRSTSYRRIHGWRRWSRRESIIYRRKRNMSSSRLRTGRAR